MGKALLAEIVRFRPPGPGPEWWLLCDLALDADDITRRTAPGLKYMTERTQAPERTVYRWLAKLTATGVLKVVQHSKSAGCGGGNGVRAVYEIQVPPMLATRIRAGLASATSPESAATGGQAIRDGIQVPQLVAGECPTRPSYVSNHLPLAAAPPLQDPIGRAPVEGAWLRPDQDRGEEEGRKNTGPECEARRAPAA